MTMNIDNLKQKLILISTFFSLFLYVSCASKGMPITQQIPEYRNDFNQKINNGYVFAEGGDLNKVVAGESNLRVKNRSTASQRY